jgi:hypothetical protein
MPKLKLELDRLTVETFGTLESGSAERGTVRAHSHVCGPTVIDPTCYETCPTAPVSCVYHCP